MKLKRLTAFALVLVMILTTTNMQIKAAHGESNVGTTKTSETGNKLVDSFAEKYYSTISLETEFTDNELLIVISRHYGVINKDYSIADMATVVKDGYLQQKDGRYELNNAAQAFQGLDIVTQINNEIAENIVKIEDLSRIDGDIDALGINRDTYKQILLLTLKNNSKENVLNIMHLLEKNPYIESAEPNFIIRDTTNDIGLKKIPTDPYYNNSWGLKAIKADKAWDETTGSRQVKVGIIDHGINYHLDLEANVLRNEGRNFANPTGNTYDFNGHGTAVAGVIGAVGNGVDGVGTCWKVGMVPLKVKQSSNESWNENHILTTRIVNAIDYANENDIPILNMSVHFNYNEYSNAVKNEIINYPGLLVTAAGNYGLNIEATYVGTDNLHKINPALYDLTNMITVCAVQKNDDGSLGLWRTGRIGDGDDSSRGPNAVHIAAPGSNILTTGDAHSYTSVSGTSFAAPFVAGTAALIKSECPGLTTAQIRASIVNTVAEIDGWENEGICLYNGVLNAEEALKYAKKLAGGTLPEGTYYIKNVRSGLYLSVRTPSAVVYSQSVQNPFTGGSEQKWRLEYSGSSLTLTPLCNTDFKLCVENSSSLNDAKIKARVPSGAHSQGYYWYAVPNYNNTGSYRLESQCSGRSKVIAVMNALFTPDADCTIRLW
ncbi:MAG: S8 family serine peptidase [Clostridiales bacterium]|nr:S8 family serine peptidase [Clostridiales bacterium]